MVSVHVGSLGFLHPGFMLSISEISTVLGPYKLQPQYVCMYICAISIGLFHSRHVGLLLDYKHRSFYKQ